MSSLTRSTEHIAAVGAEQLLLYDDMNWNLPIRHTAVLIPVCSGAPESHTAGNAAVPPPPAGVGTPACQAVTFMLVVHD